MIAESVLPKSTLLEETRVNLTGFLSDTQNWMHGQVNTIRRNYSIDFGSEEQLTKLMKSFSLWELYNSLPRYFKGEPIDEAGIPFEGRVKVTPKIVFMRMFLRAMLRLRSNIGVISMMDDIMGLLGIPNDKFVVLQNFIITDPVPNPDTTLVVERKIYVSPLANADAFLVYTPAPTNPEVLVSLSDPYFTPTNTLSVDSLVSINPVLATSFVRAFKLLVNFLKPVHVVFKDIGTALYIRSEGMVIPTRIVTTDSALRATSDRSFAYNVTNVTIAQDTGSTGRWYLDRLVPWTPNDNVITTDLVVSITDVVNAENTRVARVAELTVEDVLGTPHYRLYLDKHYTAGMVNATDVMLNLEFDIDHSILEGLVPLPTLLYNENFSIPNSTSIHTTSGNFLTQGFKVGTLLVTEGFDFNLSILDEAIITSVTANTLTINKEILVISSVVNATLVQYSDIFGSQEFGLSSRKPIIQMLDSNFTVATWQDGTIRTLDNYNTIGDTAVYRTQELDENRYNTLGEAVGGRVEFGFDSKNTYGVYGNGTVEFPYAVGFYLFDETTNWFSLGFNTGDLVSITGFSDPANNVVNKKAIIIDDGAHMLFEGVTLVGANSGPIITVSLNMKGSHT